MIGDLSAALAEQGDSASRYSSPSHDWAWRYSIVVAVLHVLSGSLSYPGIYNFFEFLNSRLAERELDYIAAPITMLDILVEGSSMLNQMEFSAAQGSSLCAGIVGCQPPDKGHWSQNFMYALERLNLEDNPGVIWFATAPWWMVANELILEYGHSWGTRFVVHHGEVGSTILVPQVAFPMASSVVEVLNIPPYLINAEMSVGEREAILQSDSNVQSEFDKVIALSLAHIANGG